LFASAFKANEIKPPAAAAPCRIIHSGGRREDFATAGRTKAVPPENEKTARKIFRAVRDSNL
jgi:hypothetical protein